MRSQKEIRKRLVSCINFILSCKSGCATKVPGAYCNYCWTMRQSGDLLDWVLGGEGNMFKKEEDGT